MTVNMSLINHFIANKSRYKKSIIVAFLFPNKPYFIFVYRQNNNQTLTSCVCRSPFTKLYTSRLPDEVPMASRSGRPESSFNVILDRLFFLFRALSYNTLHQFIGTGQGFMQDQIIALFWWTNGC